MQSGSFSLECHLGKQLREHENPLGMIRILVGDKKIERAREKDSGTGANGSLYRQRQGEIKKIN